MATAPRHWRRSASEPARSAGTAPYHLESHSGSRRSRSAAHEALSWKTEPRLRRPPRSLRSRSSSTAGYCTGLPPGWSTLIRPPGAADPTHALTRLTRHGQLVTRDSTPSGLSARALSAHSGASGSGITSTGWHAAWGGSGRLSYASHRASSFTVAAQSPPAVARRFLKGLVGFTIFSKGDAP